MLTFVFYSIFKLQFDQKKGPILLMAAAISAARTVGGASFTFKIFLPFKKEIFFIHVVIEY